MLTDFKIIMPVILDPPDYSRWLGETPATGDELQVLLRPFPVERVQVNEIGLRTGSVKNDNAA